ncbi:hypothetical protein SAMN02799624_03624 [Paenibacillus sp. UNC496MF]|uniref:DUF5666 domain-containing protein n=1 Tax=Paenibacillus sp. UNC496MF TaxID=1502753 RepID=UPI0008E96D51|nr:DUF5666 domain-containing protein [Paenibacillus sp. UNC496MF]SFJ21203.1 hypothetical protein SAMN02799624_03624 [Paenibacillus sp. UNC496MF]
MKKSVYKSAMDRVKTSEDFKAATYQKLKRELEQPARTTEPILQPNKPKERIRMERTMKRKVTGWTVGIAACAVLSVGIFAMNQGNSPATPSSPPASTSTKAPIMGKVAVNIDGVISEVGADGKSFKVGDLWVTVTDATKWGSSEPTAVAPSKEIKVGNIVSGYTAQDVSTGKVTADVIYTNLAAEKPATTGKAAVNIEGTITEVSADGKSFKVGDLWVTVTPDTAMGIDGPTAAAPSEELLQKEFKVGNVVSGYTSEDVGTGKVHATRIYNNMIPQK